MDIRNSKMVDAEGTEGDCRIFRPRKYYRNLGMSGLILLLILGIGIILEFQANAAPVEKISELIFAGSILLFFTALFIWLFASYYFASLTIQDKQLIDQGVLLRTELDLERVRQLRWIGGGAGIIKLKTLTEKNTIYLENFAYEDRLWIVEHLRNQIPESIQEGWDLFCHRIAMPLRRYNPHALPVPDQDEVLLTRKRWDRLLIPCILLFAVGGVAAAWKFGLPRLLTAPVLPTALWLYLRFATPRQGMVAKNLNADPEQKSQLAFYGWFLVVSLLLLYVSRFVNFPWLDETTFSSCVSLIAICIVFWKSYQFGKAIEQKHREASKASVKEWDAGQKTSIP